jgi:uncharacterized repeat protein (TIGR03803 family)
MSPSGNLYGTTSTGGTWRNEPGFGVVYKMDPITGVEKVLTTFTGVLGDGANPVGTLVRDSSGNLYGTTVDGGAHKQGTLYEITPTGEKIGQLVFDGANGGTSFAGLVLDKKGNLYGTTSAGGTTGNGVVFRLHISPRKDTVLYNFTGSGGDGSDPIGALLRDAAGNLYGTTPIGGIYGGACGSKGCGIVFKIEPSGTETVLYSFSGGSDGANPQYATLICDTKGNLYGTASAGGDSNLGVVFKLNKKGKETVLYSFMGGADGASPYSGVIRDQAGNLYGSTLQGGGTGCSDQMGCGTIFKLSTTGGRLFCTASPEEVTGRTRGVCCKTRRATSTERPGTGAGGTRRYVAQKAAESYSRSRLESSHSLREMNTVRPNRRNSLHASQVTLSGHFTQIPSGKVDERNRDLS